MLWHSCAAYRTGPSRHGLGSGYCIMPRVDIPTSQSHCQLFSEDSTQSCKTVARHSSTLDEWMWHSLPQRLMRCQVGQRCTALSAPSHWQACRPNTPWPVLPPRCSRPPPAAAPVVPPGDKSSSRILLPALVPDHFNELAQGHQQSTAQAYTHAEQLAQPAGSSGGRQQQPCLSNSCI